MEWWKSLFRKRALDAQLDSELRFHIEELTEANVAAGLTAEEARRRALLEFGGREQIKEELRDVHRVSIVESTLANLKSAFRFIRKSPSFSMTVIVLLAASLHRRSKRSRKEAARQWAFFFHRGHYAGVLFVS